MSRLAPLLSRLRRTPVALTAAVLVLLGFLDALLTEFRWPLLVFLAVSVLAATSLTQSSEHGDRADRRHSAAAAAAVLLSWAGTAVMAVAMPTWAGSFGLVEAAALLLLLVPQWRHASSSGDWARTWALAVAVVALPVRVLNPDTPVFMIVMAAGTAVVVATAVALRGQDTVRRTAVEAVRRTEREELARELHDVAAHHVTGIIVATQAARTVGAKQNELSPELSAALASIEGAGAEAMAAMRRLVGVLRTDSAGHGPDTFPAAGTGRGGAGHAAPAPLQPPPTLSGLPDLVRRFRDSGSCGTIKLSPAHGDGRDDLPVELQSSLYRVVQESLTNIARHARGAAHVRVDVHSDPAAVTVQVTNSAGQAQHAEVAHPGGGYGILGMRERMAVFDGTLSAGPDGQGGWSVTATAPQPRPAESSRRNL